MDVPLRAFDHEPTTSDDAHDSLGEVEDYAYCAIATRVRVGEDPFQDLNGLADCVYVKNSHGVVVYSNQAHRSRFAPRESPIGRTAECYLDPSVAARTVKAEELILAGCPYMECEHTGPAADGIVYRFQARKRSLRPLAAPGLAILGIVRVLEPVSDPAEKALGIDQAAERLRGLSARDREICRLTALGVSSRELGERMGMTTRGIELRKQKAFAHLGVSKAVDLARLLTRLQDRGHADLGL